jgi:hypothetical protein
MFLVFVEVVCDTPIFELAILKGQCSVFFGQLFNLLPELLFKKVIFFDDFHDNSFSLLLDVWGSILLNYP